MNKVTRVIKRVPQHKRLDPFLLTAVIGLMFILTISAQAPPAGSPVPAGATFPTGIGGLPGAGRSSQPRGPWYPMRVPNAIEGTWECSNGSETMGLYVSEFLMPSWNANPPNTKFIEIYRIQDGRVDEEFFYPGTDPAARVESSPNHLKIHFESGSRGSSRFPNIDLDITFDSLGRRWTGTGSLCSPSGEVLLEQPHSDNPLVGDWRDSCEGPDVPPFGKPLWIGSDFHIRQTLKGGLIVWQDEISGHAPAGAQSVSTYDMIWTMRMEPSWEILKQSPSRLTLRYIPCIVCNNYDYTFEGAVSNSSSRLITGTWFEINHGQKAEYSTSFHRLN